MRGMNNQSVDLIYLDPPFNSNANYAAPIGSPAVGADFKDVWSLDDIKIEWLHKLKDKNPYLYHVLLAGYDDSSKSYLVYMAIRLLEMYRILKESGSIYLHCDAYMSHHLKLCLDAIWGRNNFLGELIWNKQNGVKTRTAWGKENESILCYAKKKGKHTFKPELEINRIPFSKTSIEMHFTHFDSNGRRYRERRVNNKVYKYYADKGRFIGNLWNDISSMTSNSPLMKQTKGYKTQKPEDLLNRIIQSSSNEGEMIFDPFCGCATTCVVADRINRKWIGIDISPKAAELVVKRIAEDQGVIFGQQGNQTSIINSIIHRTDIPKRTDLGKIPKYNSTQNKQKLYGQQGGYCNGCGTHFELRNLTIDHITSRSEGGTDHIENLQLLCGNCNSVKGNRGMTYLKKQREYLKKNLKLVAA